MTEKDLLTIFSPFGTILNCQLSPNPGTGKHKGFGYYLGFLKQIILIIDNLILQRFIDFEEATSAAQAIATMNGFLLAGRQMKVAPAAAASNILIDQLASIPNTSNGMIFILNLFVTF